MDGVPHGFHTLTTYVFVDDADHAIDFYRDVFDAKQLLRLAGPEGRVLHAELQIGDAQLMVADRPPEAADALIDQGAPEGRFGIHLYVADADATIARAVEAGAKLLDGATDADEGERRGGIRDPFGITWWIATQHSALTREEIQRRFDSRH